ncbi:MAG: YgiT-type zinc finger protein [Acidobacteria bacterium]|nr:YgiT-type zinc finger protein [Acidobacteriota bacterium]
MDRVPAWVCTRCAEQYFDAPVYKRLEQIARQRKSINKIVSPCYADRNYELCAPVSRLEQRERST